MVSHPKNRLAKEASPYLQQHATNPVDWYPWGEEALARARSEDRPILLSVGYSACHWCHVMERESFEDPDIAARMNEHFVCIKVDREERPDLDQIYQLVVQLMGRSGGWPLTVFLTPDQRPFFGGTYFPPVEKYGMPGFPTLLAAIVDAYRNKRAEIADQAHELTAAISKIARPGRPRGLPAPGGDLLARAAKTLASRFDDEHGGFGQRPKFPNTMPLEVLLRHGVSSSESSAELRVATALSSMRDGGVHDQLGGGFHRYSTDEAWRVPHFEKMLYDNALLMRLYTDAARALECADHEATARDVARYLLRDMRDEGGGFYAAEDADSEGEEGKFFVFSRAEILEIVGDPGLTRLLSSHLGVTEEGNFEHTGKTVLSVQRSVARLSVEQGVAPSELASELARGKALLFAARERRPRPFRDEKILASWNGLAISAFAEAGSAFAEPSFIEAAERALSFVKRTLVRGDDPLRVERHVKGEVVKGPGFLDDHAFVANAALDLYEATGEPGHALFARRVADAMVARFWEEEQGFVFTGADSEPVLVRAKDPHDNAVPSGTSIACRVLLRLGALMDANYTVHAETELLRLAPSCLENPFGFGQALCELDRLIRGSVDVVLVGARSDARLLALARVVHSLWIPNRTLAWLDPSDPLSREACAALAEGKEAKAEPAAYVCRGRSCSLPVTTPEELRALLTK